jgi:hypothetical protein
MRLTRNFIIYPNEIAENPGERPDETEETQ